MAVTVAPDPASNKGLEWCRGGGGASGVRVMAEFFTADFRIEVDASRTPAWQAGSACWCR